MPSRTPSQIRALRGAIGERFRELRIAAGLGQEQLGFYVHKRQQGIHNIESGKAPLHVSDWLHIAEEIGVNPCTIFESVELETAPQRAMARRLIMDFNDITPDEQQAVCQLVRAIRKKGRSNAR
jgi:transcriptional regulator with XRE-family HTH domain